MKTFLSILVWLLIIYLIYRFFKKSKNKGSVPKMKNPPDPPKKNDQKQVKEDLDNIIRILEEPFDLAEENAEPYFLIYDCETTGLLPGHSDYKLHEDFPWPVQLAWSVFDFDGNIIKTNSEIIFQEIEIPSEATKVHKISTLKMKEEGKNPIEIYDEFLADIKSSKCVVAHNVEYDDLVMKAEFIRKGVKISKFSKKRICTMKKSKNFCAIPFPYSKPGYKYPKLQELVACLYSKTLMPHQLKLKNMHDASIDVHITAKCFFELLHVWEEIKIERE